MTRQYGFTLIELLVVIAICGILVTLGVFSFKRLAEEGRVESAAQSFRRLVYQARATAARRDRPTQVAFNSALPEGNLVSFDNSSGSVSGYSATGMRTWQDGAAAFIHDKTPNGPSIYSDAPEDQWYTIIGSTIKRDGWNWNSDIGLRAADANETPLTGVHPNNAWCLDLYHKNKGTWDPQDIQIGKRHYMPDGVRYWRAMDFVDWDTEKDDGVDKGIRSECIGAWPDGITAARMCGGIETKDAGSARVNVNVYPRGTFGTGTCASYMARGGRFSHIYTGFVSRQNNDIRRIVTLNPVTGAVLTARDWDLPR